MPAARAAPGSLFPPREEDGLPFRLTGMGKKLASPPIVEVVCGFFFPPIQDLDPIVIGKLWYERRKEFPHHSVQPPVMEEGGLMLAVGAGPLRSWFVSDDDEYVIQIQPDRFYLNWRKREGGYPRFHDDGEKHGVMSRALDEFDRFAAFCADALSTRPAVNYVEVAKVDLLLQGTHWQTAADLSTLMPLLGGLRAVAATEDAEVTARVAETRPEGEFLLSAHCGMQEIFGNIPARAVRIETRARREIGEGTTNYGEHLSSLNNLLNEAFWGLVSDAELSRFGGITQ